jgi:hypothetical protein
MVLCALLIIIATQHSVQRTRDKWDRRVFSQFSTPQQDFVFEP